jgi:hypothetical protein
MVRKFRKKPVVIEAIQWNGENYNEICSFVGDEDLVFEYYKHPVEFRHLIIQTLEGEMRASYQDWIIKGVKGEFYPCKPDIFESTYEAENDDTE